MDTLLQRVKLGLNDLKKFSFNPCFNGYTTSTAADEAIADLNEQVSILVLMDTLLQPYQKF